MTLALVPQKNLTTRIRRVKFDLYHLYYGQYKVFFADKWTNRQMNRSKTNCPRSIDVGALKKKLFRLWFNSFCLRKCPITKKKKKNTEVTSFFVLLNSIYFPMGITPF